MKTLSWNCRGLGNPGTVRALKKILSLEKPTIVFLMETRLKSNQMGLLNGTHFKFERCLPIDCEGENRSRRGGLCVLWTGSFSKNHMSFKVSRMGDNTSWVFSGIYGWPETQNRNRTWRLMNDIKPYQGTPWLLIGDFNALLWSSEKRGGNKKSWKEMNDFWESIQGCNLTDLGFSGNHFTWSNGRGRALASSGWQTIFPAYRIRHLPRFKSDHNPVVVEYYENDEDGVCSRRKKRRFRFENMWLQHPLFTKTLTKMWKKNGRSMNYVEKAKTFGNELLNWDQAEFGNIRKKVKELNQTLSDMQNQEQTENIVKETHKTEIELDKVLKMEE